MLTVFSVVFDLALHFYIYVLLFCLSVRFYVLLRVVAFFWSVILRFVFFVDALFCLLPLQQPLA